MKVYVAGKMRGVPEFNFPAFNSTAEYLRDLGHTVFNPAERDAEAGFKTEGMMGHEDLTEHGFDLRAALYDDLAFVTREADAICVLPNWENSAGARAEVATAHALGLKVGTWQAFKQVDGEPGEFDERHAIKSDLQPSGKLIETVALADGPIGNRHLAPVTNIHETHWHLTENQKVKQLGNAIVINPVRTQYDVKQAQQPTNKDVKRPYSLPRIPRSEYERSRQDHPAGKKRDEGGLISPLGETRLPGMVGEVRSVSSTGGEKGIKIERFDLIPPAIAQVARHYGVGAEKYDANQYRRGYEFSKSYAALQRHANQWWAGEDIDKETGSNHMAAVAWHALTLLTFQEEHPEFDDRYKKAE